MRNDENAGVTVPVVARVHDLHRRLLRAAMRDPIEVADLAIDGDDLRRAGIRPGPEFAILFGKLLADVLDDPSRNTTEWLTARVATLRPSPADGN